MNEPVVVVQDLVKQYGGLRAADGVTLTVERGEIFGLLGRNGAGKTTTLRAILGLCRPTSGTVRVHGLAPGTPAAMIQTGALIENPAFYPYLNARDNLRVLARMRRLADSAVDDVLVTVGLAEYATAKFREYSLGMKQRLGLAGALLGEPALLVLDEPTNGLDPKGIADVRALLVTLRDKGRSIILSSHLLGEVERVCDRVSVLETGRVVATGTVAELGSALSATTISISATPIGAALTTLRAHAAVLSVEEMAGRLSVTTAAEATDRTVAELNSALVLAGILVHDLRIDRPGLEQVYLTLTANSERS